MGGNERPHQPLRKTATSQTRPLLPPLCPSRVGRTRPRARLPSEPECPRNKGEGIVCLDLGTRYRIRDHSLSERPGWLVLRVCFYLLLSAHETFRGLP